MGWGELIGLITKAFVIAAIGAGAFRELFVRHLQQPNSDQKHSFGSLPELL
jgi:hypothetical protein